MKKRYDLTTIHGILASSEDHELTISPSLYFRLGEQTSDTSDGEFEITLAGQDIAARRLIAAIQQGGPARVDEAPEFIVEKGVGLGLEGWSWVQLRVEGVTGGGGDGCCWGCEK
jgi:hypothetical protein